MKNIIFTLSFLMVASFAYSQLKVDTQGDVGIGIANPVKKLEVDGDARVHGNVLDVGYNFAGTQSVSLNVGGGRTSDGPTAIDLVADASLYPNFGFRFQRLTNGSTTVTHRGTLPFQIRLQEAARLQIYTSNVERMRIMDDGRVGIGTLSPTAGFDLTVGSDIRANGITIPSDKRLKRDAKALEYGLKEVLQLQPLTYFYTGEAGTDEKRLHTGVYAQELQAVMPNLVSEYTYDTENEEGEVISTETYLQIDDTAIKFALINAIKEQQAIIDEKDAQISALEAKFEEFERTLETIKQNGLSGVVQSEVTLTYHDMASVEQNVPNPFNGSTRISYIVPSEANTAKIEIFDNYGKMVKSVDVDHTGEGMLTVRAEDIPSGTYSYRLIVDGKMISTKQMIVAQ